MMRPLLGLALASTMVASPVPADCVASPYGEPASLAVDLGCGEGAEEPAILRMEHFGDAPDSFMDPRTVVISLERPGTSARSWTTRRAKWDEGTSRMLHRVTVAKDCAEQRAWVGWTWWETVAADGPQVMVRVEELALRDLRSLRSWEIRLPRPSGDNGTTSVALSLAAGIVEFRWIGVDVTGARTARFVLGLDPATGTWTDRTAQPVILTSVQSTKDAIDGALQDIMRGVDPPKP